MAKRPARAWWLGETSTPSRRCLPSALCTVLDRPKRAKDGSPSTCARWPKTWSKLRFSLTTKTTWWMGLWRRPGAGRVEPQSVGAQGDAEGQDPAQALHSGQLQLDLAGDAAGSRVDHRHAVVGGVGNVDLVPAYGQGGGAGPSHGAQAFPVGPDQ